MKTENTRSKALAYAAIIASSLLWSIVGMWNRRLMAAGLSPACIAAIRNFGCMALLCLIFAVRDRSVFRMDRRHIKYFVGIGVGGVVMYSVCYFSCQKLCSLAVASVLTYTSPLFVVLLSALLWKEPVTKRKCLALALTLTGCAFVCGLFSGGVSATLPGVLLGLGSGFFYALYSIFGRCALEHYSSMAVTVWAFIIAGPASLVLLRPAEAAAAFSGDAGVWLVALGLIAFSGALPYLLYTWGLSRVGPEHASIISGAGLAVVAISGAVFFSEPIGPMTVLGIFCVLAGVIILR